MNNNQKMKDAFNNVKASFEANPKVNQFFVDENGHCYTHQAPNTVLVNRSEVERFGSLDDMTHEMEALQDELRNEHRPVTDESEVEAQPEESTDSTSEESMIEPEPEPETKSGKKNKK